MAHIESRAETVDEPEDDKHTFAPTIEDKDVYKIALDTRNFEISLFWQRSNYFLVLNSALALGFFNLQKDLFAFLLAVFGLLVSFLWFRVNLGSKFWQSRWEQRLAEIERKIGPELFLFSATREILDRDVAKSLAIDDEKSCIRRWLKTRILQKPSVSYNMTLLSLFFVVGWAVLIALKCWLVFA